MQLNSIGKYIYFGGVVEQKPILESGAAAAAERIKCVQVLDTQMNCMVCTVVFCTTSDCDDTKSLQVLSTFKTFKTFNRQMHLFLSPDPNPFVLPKKYNPNLFERLLRLNGFDFNQYNRPMDCAAMENIGELSNGFCQVVFGVHAYYISMMLL